MLTREAWNALLKILEEPPPGHLHLRHHRAPEDRTDCGPHPLPLPAVRLPPGRGGDIVTASGGAGEEGAEASGRGAPDHRPEGGWGDAGRALAHLDQVLALSEESGGRSSRSAGSWGWSEEERYLRALRPSGGRGPGRPLPPRGGPPGPGVRPGGVLPRAPGGLRTLLRLRVGGDGADLRGAPRRGARGWRGARERPAHGAVRGRRPRPDAGDGGRAGDRGKPPEQPNQPRVLLELLLLRFSYLDPAAVELEAESWRPSDGSPSGSGNGGADLHRERCRTGRLQDLLEKEPGLRPAVEELDLELVD
jgi:hypothetical protein